MKIVQPFMRYRGNTNSIWPDEWMNKRTDGRTENRAADISGGEGIVNQILFWRQHSGQCQLCLSESDVRSYELVDEKRPEVTRGECLSAVIQCRRRSWRHSSACSDSTMRGTGTVRNCSAAIPLKTSAPSTPATMSKQHCRMLQVERCFRQSRNKSNMFNLFRLCWNGEILR